VTYKNSQFLVVKEVFMAKLTAWLVTIVGILLVLALLSPVAFNALWVQWVIALAVLAVGVGKLLRNYSKRRR
jgi:membrane protein required for beta-lactamase induction